MNVRTTETLALDRASVRSRDAEGFLHVSESPISKAGINEYYGREVPGWQSLGLDSERKYRLLRDPVELEKSAPTFDGKPLLSQHKPQAAASHDNDITVGAVSNVRWSSPYLIARLDIWDGDAIEAVENGSQRELSSGYRYTPDVTPGTFEGQAYDIRMTDIIGNHVSLVTRGRAGPDVVVADSVPVEPTNSISQTTEKRQMAKKILSRQAANAKSALTAHLRTQLAQDAELGDLIELLETLQAAPDADANADPVTEISEDDDCEAQIRAICAGKLTDEEIAKIVAMLPKATDEEADAEAQAAEEAAAAAMAEKAEADRKAIEAAAAGESDKVSKQAMDAAIAAAVKSAEANTIARLRAARDAEKAVAPYVGTLAIAMDSADEIYAAALKTLGVDIKGVHPSAFPAILKAQALPGGARASASQPTLAADADPAADFSKRFPAASRIRLA